MNQKVFNIILILLVLMAFVLPVGADGSEILGFFENLLEENGGVPVNVQDQTTRPFAIRANQITDLNFELVSVPVVDSYDLVLNDTSNLSIGESLAFLEQNGMPQILFGDIVNIVGNIVTLDSPVPYNFTPLQTVVFKFDNSLTNDGSIDTEVFGITNFFEESIDITRIIFSCRNTVAMDDSTFCGLNELPRGIILRKKKIDGNYINYWNIKTNGQWGDLAFDVDESPKAPAGENGFKSRLTYGGQSKFGVVIRLVPGESLEVLNQDDLTSLTYGSLMFEGHFIQN